MYTQLSVAESDGGSLLRATAALNRLHAAGEVVEATVFPAVVEDFHRMERRRFDAQGPGWAPLSAMTLAMRARKGITSTRILEATGRLRAAMTGESDELRVVFAPDELLISLPFYGEFHQIGPRQIRVFGRGSAILPQRKVFEVRDVDALRWSRIVKKGLGLYGADPVLDLDSLDA